MKTLISTLFLLLSFNALSYEIFVIEKSANPKNVLHFHANVEACEFQTPAIRNFWIMGEEDGQRENINSAERPFFTPKMSYQSKKEVDFTMGVIEKMKGKVDDPKVKVRLVNCKPKAYFEVEGNEIQVKRIFVKVNMLINVKYVTITGIAANGSMVTYTIK